MKFRQLFPIIAILVSLGATGCKDTVIQPELTGSLVGYVYTFDEFANLLDDHSNVKVTALGLEQFSTSTDKKGRFEFKGLPAGTFELHFEKEGFGTLKQFGIQHLGGQPTTLGLSYDGSVNSSAFFIYQMPTSEILSLSIDNDTISGSFSFKADPPQSFLLSISFSSQKDFEISNARFVTSTFLYNVDGIYKGKIFGLESAFQPGEEVFYKACFYSSRGAIEDFSNRIIAGINSYFDYSENTVIYPNMGDESAQYSFIYEK
jgi:hypothetical protein